MRGRLRKLYAAVVIAARVYRANKKAGDVRVGGCMATAAPDTDAAHYCAIHPPFGMGEGIDVSAHVFQKLQGYENVPGVTVPRRDVHEDGLYRGGRAVTCDLSLSDIYYV